MNDLTLVLLFPGQGSQKPGMAQDLVKHHSQAREVFARADAVLGMELSRLCFEGPSEELTLTHNAQPALFVHGAALWAVIRDVIGAGVVAAAGHSLGEFTAYNAAGALTLEAGVQLVRRRGELMRDAGLARPGTMAAILGDMDRPAEELCEQASAEAGTVVPANYNAPGQLVLSGEVAGVERAMELAKEAGAKRALRLNVSGAFHSPLVAPAAEGLRDALARAAIGAPRFPVASNVTAELVHGSAEATDVLQRQLTSPVRWTECVRTLAAAFPSALFVELGPGAVLTGLVKRIAPELSTAACGTSADVEDLLARIT